MNENAKLATPSKKAILVVCSGTAVGKALEKSPVLPDKPPAAWTAPLKKPDEQLLLTAA